MCDEAAAHEEERFFRRALLAQLGTELGPRPIVRQRALDETPEEERLLLPLHDQLPAQVDTSMDGVARGLQLLAPVAILRRLDFPEQAPQVEEAVDTAQQHLQLEEDLLPAADLEAADPALALGEIDGANPLRVAHQLEEEVLRE